MAYNLPLSITSHIYLSINFLRPKMCDSIKSYYSENYIIKNKQIQIKTNTRAQKSITCTNVHLLVLVKNDYFFFYFI